MHVCLVHFDKQPSNNCPLLARHVLRLPILMTLPCVRRLFYVGLKPAYMSVQDAPRNVVPFMPPTLSYLSLA